jgi:hypothetical protein
VNLFGRGQTGFSQQFLDKRAQLAVLSTGLFSRRGRAVGS